VNHVNIHLIKYAKEKKHKDQKRERTKHNSAILLKGTNVSEALYCTLRLINIIFERLALPC